MSIARIYRCYWRAGKVSIAKPEAFVLSLHGCVDTPAAPLFRQVEERRRHVVMLFASG